MDEGVESHNTLKALLRSGMRAISQFVSKEDDAILEDDPVSVIPIAVCCALVIDQTANSPFVESEAQDRAKTLIRLLVPRIDALGTIGAMGGINAQYIPRENLEGPGPKNSILEAVKGM